MGLPGRQEPQHRRNANARVDTARRAQFRLGGGAHHGDVGQVAEPQLLLQGGLVDEHAEPVERPRPGIAGGAEQGGVERVVDEVGDEVLGVQHRRVEREIVGGEPDGRGVDDQLGGAQLGGDIGRGWPRRQRREGDDVGDPASVFG